MIDVQYRHWQPGDDEPLWPMLAEPDWTTRAQYERKLTDPGLAPEGILLAEAGGKPVGHIMACVRHLRFGQATLRFGGIGQFVVDPQFRENGIGQTLFRQATDYLRAQGCLGMLLFTKQDLTPAHAMYERAGLTDIGRHVWLEYPVRGLPPAPADSWVRRLDERDTAACEALFARWTLRHGCVCRRHNLFRMARELEVLEDANGLAALVRVTLDADQYVIHGLIARPGTDVDGVVAACAAVRALGPKEHIYLATNSGNELARDRADGPAKRIEGKGVLMARVFEVKPVLAALAEEHSWRMKRLGREFRLVLRVGEQCAGVRSPGGQGAPAREVAMSPQTFTRLLLGGLSVGQTASKHLLTGADPDTQALLRDVVFPFEHCDTSRISCW